MSEEVKKQPILVKLSGGGRRGVGGVGKKAGDLFEVSLTTPTVGGTGAGKRGLQAPAGGAGI